MVQRALTIETARGGGNPSTWQRIVFPILGVLVALLLYWYYKVGRHLDFCARKEKNREEKEKPVSLGDTESNLTDSTTES